MMNLEINSVHQVYEILHALDERLEGHMKRIESLEKQERFLKSLRIDLDLIDKTVGKAMASTKRDARTNLQLTQEIEKIIEVMKCLQLPQELTTKDIADYLFGEE